MTISDTLFDAIVEIENYQKEERYEGLEEEIEKVKKVMELLRRYLDTSPVVFNKFAAPLLKTLKELDVTSIDKAFEENEKKIKELRNH